MTVKVEKTRMIGGNQITLSAWRMEPLMAPHTHTTTRHFEEYPGRTFGRIGSERYLPPEIENLPFNAARGMAVRHWQASRDQEAYAYIYAAHPELEFMRPTIGSGYVFYCEEDDDRVQA